MRTTIDLPESVYQRSEQLARRRGFSVEQLIVRVLERELAHEPAAPSSSKKVSLPLISSKHPGSLDLANFDFDDLLS
jgi:predicted DNA-binding ribbon-helix-helix protein